MPIEPLISWSAPERYYTEKRPDWYWSVGIITLALVVVTLIFGNIIMAILFLVGAVALVLHAAHPPRIVEYKINDRGILIDDILFPFVSLDSFWMPHDHQPAKLILKSRKLFMPYVVIYIDEVNPEDVRQILLTYIAETEHRESFFTHLLERWGF